MKIYIVFFALLVCIGIQMVQSAYFIPGPCPEGHSEGDIWSKGCTHCQCLSNGHTCAGCYTAMLPAKPGCVKSPYNYTLSYPDCCPQMVC